ncbi:hypothetical protein T03_14399 [Trichinella britovi]|uniref:Uncharacterized protein n=1 Tax=Trichinella britovi TaxID=45882 RepID=A0A0V0YU39_TRIBR|nr:hypothetical protein T03_14399 [Trichinella britovi]
MSSLIIRQNYATIFSHGKEMHCHSSSITFYNMAISLLPGRIY